MSNHDHSSANTGYPTTGGVKILLPLALLISLAVGAWYLLGKDIVHHEKQGAHEVHAAQGH